MHYQLKIGTENFSVEVDAQPGGSLKVSVNGTPYEVILMQESSPAVSRPTASETAIGALPERAAPPAAPAPVDSVGGAVLAPIPGLILEIKVRVGDSVEAGQAVAVMEAMKMENNLVTPVAGVVKEILAQKGSEVATGDVILRVG